MTQWIIIDDLVVNSVCSTHVPVLKTFKTSEEAWQYSEQTLIPEMRKEFEAMLAEDIIDSLECEQDGGRFAYNHRDYLNNFIGGELRVQPIDVEGP